MLNWQTCTLISVPAPAGNHDRLGWVVAVCFQGPDDLCQRLEPDGRAITFKLHSLSCISREGRLMVVGGYDPSGAFAMQRHRGATKRALQS